MLKYRKRFGCTLKSESYDTLLRMSAATMIDRTKIVNKALDEYLLAHGYELRDNTEAESSELESK